MDWKFLLHFIVPESQRVSGEYRKRGNTAHSTDGPVAVLYANVAIAVIAALIGYFVVESLRKKL
jgi:hypothetical protein